MEHNEVKKLLNLAKHFQVKILKVDGFEVTFQESIPVPKEPADAPQKSDMEGAMPDDEEMLGYSSPIKFIDATPRPHED